MAGQGIKNFASGAVLTAAQLDGYLMEQSMMVFASEAARTSAFSSESVTAAQGMFSVTTDTDTIWYHDGSAWTEFSSPPIDYTPAWSGFTVGSATVVASYQWMPGRVLRVWGQCTLAGDSSFSGALQQTIPLSETASAKGATGTALLNDVGTTIYVGLVHCVPSSTAIDFHHAESATNGGLVGATAPFTWTTSDVFTWDIIIPTA